MIRVGASMPVSPRAGDPRLREELAARVPVSRPAVVRFRPPGGTCAEMVAPFAGTSILDSVLIGACCDQPRCTQYALAAENVVTSMSVTHLVADT